jgi:P-type Ca2+ transporter type 2C
MEEKKTIGDRQVNLDHWWADPGDELAKRLRVDANKGLSNKQVEEFRDQFGRNQLEDTGATSLVTLLWESIKTPMMLLLLTIAGISLILRQLREAVVMLFVVAMYVGVHLLNKARSDRTMARLREVQAPKTAVLRDGERKEIPVEELVVGDILPLQAGSRVPADARLLSTAGLLVNEAALTGESAPVQKDAVAKIKPDTHLAERYTAIFAGTTVIDGQGTAIVMAVGGDSELGRVARLSTRADTEPTPLQKEMNDMARTLAFVALGVSLLIPLVGLLQGFDFQQMILTWLSLTFLMVPGQPPIIISMALALASLELARKKVIVRRLHGAETLGSVNVVLSDKTGTITENKMTLSGVILPDGKLHEWNDSQGRTDELWQQFFRYALPAIPEHANDPTDLALENAANTKEGFQQETSGRLVSQHGFARSNQYRSLEYQKDSRNYLYVTGRPEWVMEHSNRKQTISGTKEWTKKERQDLYKKIEDQAEQGKRITAYGYREGNSSDKEPSDLIFVGAAIISDPIRPEVKDAVRQLSDAGVLTVMVTGDIPQTAAFIAREIGISGDNVLTGNDLEGKSEKEIEAMVQSSHAFARATPEQKLRLVEAFKRLGQTVAVTGDGINDAPALHTAHVGIAMGQKGTDVAKEAADLILTDNNFAHLTDGVAIGRKAYDNFRKGITYYLSAKAILLSIFMIPLLVGVPFPLAPIQIIFTELLMDLASSTIFVTEEAEPDIMKRKPRKRGRFLSPMVARRIFRNMVGLSLTILVVYFGSLSIGYSLDSARTAAFATWLLGHIVLAMILKQEKTPLLKQGLFSNRFAIGWLFGMIAFVFAMTLIPFVQAIVKTTNLSALQWGMVVGGALIASIWIEIGKWIRPDQIVQEA